MPRLFYDRVTSCVLAIASTGWLIATLINGANSLN